ncbi:MAG: hypothetical protein JNM93_08070, partial [Bacteriovoracaceae bacterium]|nr:hypothetical protein [Bacteriovoracaceae bacterium]
NEVAAHSLCGISDSNDPLKHTVTIKQFPFNYLLHNSNYMVEHYLYPQLSFSKLPKIQKGLKKHFKSEYKQISKFRAMMYLYSLPKVYKSNTEVIHPVTEKTYTLPLK